MNSEREASTSDDAKHVQVPADFTRSMPAKGWHTYIQDAGDGSGDGVIQLPDELLARLGWKIGDELTIEEIGPGCLRLRR